LTSTAPPRLPRAVRLAFAAALTAYLACAAWLVWRTAILEPYSDMYAWMARWYRFRADGDLARYLWAPHNFHHLDWTFAILDLDIRTFGASSYLFLAVGVICLGATAALLAWVAAKAAGPGFRLVGAGVAAALSAMGCHILDVNADIETTYVHALLFAVAAIVLAEAPGRRPALRRAGALVCAIAAGLGNAAGLAVWPALLFVAWRAGRRGWALVVLAAGGAYGLLYLLGEPTSGGAGAGAVGARLAEAAALAVNYLALPWVRAAPAIGWPLGLVVLAIALAAIIFRGRRGAAWTESAAVALILFTLATAVMAGAGRTGLIAPNMVPMRYAVFLIPLHVGLWILALPHVRQAWPQRPRTVAGAVMGLAVVMLVHQGVMAVFAMRTADANLRVVADFRNGKRSPQMLTTINPDLGAAQALALRMQGDGFYQRELRPDPVAPASGGSGISASSTDP
jgi:hypothetical protein